MIFLAFICGLLVINPYYICISLAILPPFRSLGWFYRLSVCYSIIASNLREQGNFLYASTGDDGDDYIVASRYLANIKDIDLSFFNDASIPGVLQHNDRIFAILQFLLSKMIEPNYIPILFSAIFALILAFGPFIASKTLSKELHIPPYLLNLAFLTCPFILYLSQHLYRQALAISLECAFVAPTLILYVNKPTRRRLHILLVLALICLGIHVGSTLPLAVLVLFTILLEQNLSLLSDMRRLIIRYKNPSLFVFLSVTPLLSFFINNKYLYQFFNLITLFSFRDNNSGLRTSILAIAISVIINLSLKTYGASKAKQLVRNFSNINAVMGLITIALGSLERVLFSSTLFLIFLFLFLSGHISKSSVSLFRYFSISISILVVLFYSFLREAFWGNGSAILVPYYGNIF